MSRSGRMIIVLGIALLLIVIWSSFIAPISTSWAEASDNIAAQADRVDQAGARAAAQRANVCL